MRVFVTGATGFVGAALLQRLRAAGHGVLAAYHRRAPVEIPGVDWVAIGDLQSATGLRPLLAGADAVIHLAALAHLPARDPGANAQQYLRVNADGTARLAQAAAEAKVRRFVLLSSVKACAEDSGDGRLRESDAKAPRDPYGVSKAMAEEHLHRIADACALEAVVVRPPLVYGPGVRANFLALMRWIDRGVPLPFACVDNRRSLVYVGNLADALLACVEKPHAARGTYFVSDGEDLSTPALVRQIAAALGKPARLWPMPTALLRALGHVSGRSAAVGRLLGSLAVDTSRIRDELGWRPPFSLESGLAETAAWYRREARSGANSHV